MFKKKLKIDIVNNDLEKIKKYLEQFIKIENLKNDKYFKNVYYFIAEISASQFDFLKNELEIMYNCFLNINYR